MTSQTPEAVGRRLNVIVRWSWITLALLLVQNALGMYLNLYADLTAFPNVEDAFRSVPALGIHVLTAFAIIGSSAYVLARGLRASDRIVQLTALAGLAFVLLAFFSGIEFTFYGEVDAFSFLMEVGFLGIVACVAFSLYRVSRLRVILRTEATSLVGGISPGPRGD